MTREEILKKLEASYKNTESELELAAMLVFDELGWEVIYAEHEMDGDETILGRTHHGEVILERYLLPAFKDLNIDFLLDETVKPKSARKTEAKKKRGKIHLRLNLLKMLTLVPFGLNKLHFLE